MTLSPDARDIKWFAIGFFVGGLTATGAITLLAS